MAPAKKIWHINFTHSKLERPTVAISLRYLITRNSFNKADCPEKCTIIWASDDHELLRQGSICQGSRPMPPSLWLPLWHMSHRCPSSRWLHIELFPHAILRESLEALVTTKQYQAQPVNQIPRVTKIAIGAHLPVYHGTPCCSTPRSSQCGPEICSRWYQWQAVTRRHGLGAAEGNPFGQLESPGSSGSSGCVWKQGILQMAIEDIQDIEKWW